MQTTQQSAATRRTLPLKNQLVNAQNATTFVNGINVSDMKRNDFEVALLKATKYQLPKLLSFFDGELSQTITSIEFANNLNMPNIKKIRAMAEAYNGVIDASAELLDHTSNLPTFADSLTYLEFLNAYYEQACQLLLKMTRMSSNNIVLRDMFMPQIFLIGYDLSKMFLKVNGIQPNKPLVSVGAKSISYYALDDTSVGRTNNTELPIPIAPIADYINVVSNNFSAFVQLSSLKLYGAWENGDNTNFSEITSGTTGGASLNANFAGPLTSSDGNVSISVLYSSSTAGGKTTITDNSDEVYICLADLSGQDPANNPGWSGLPLDIVKDLTDESQFIPLSTFEGQYYIQKINEVDTGAWYLDPNTEDKNIPDHTFATKLVQYLNNNLIYSMTYINKRPAVINGKPIQVVDFPTQNFESTYTFNIKTNYDLSIPAPPYFTVDDTVDNKLVVKVFGDINVGLPRFMLALGACRDRCLRLVNNIQSENKSIAEAAKGVYNNFESVKDEVLEDLRTLQGSLSAAIDEEKILKQ